MERVQPSMRIPRGRPEAGRLGDRHRVRPGDIGRPSPRDGRREASRSRCSRPRQSRHLGGVAGAGSGAPSRRTRRIGGVSPSRGPWLSQVTSARLIPWRDTHSMAIPSRTFSSAERSRSFGSHSPAARRVLRPMSHHPRHQSSGAMICTIGASSDTSMAQRSLASAAIARWLAWTTAA